MPVYLSSNGARVGGGTVGWSNALQDGKSRVRFLKRNDLIFPPLYDPVVYLASNRNQDQGCVQGGK